MTRQTGQTTTQLRNAPAGATFVWPVDSTYYPRALARYVGRRDLRIVGPSALTDGRCQGLTPERLILDHAVRLTPRQQREVDILETMRR
jgi:hypothetical protein